MFRVGGQPCSSENSEAPAWCMCRYVTLLILSQVLKRHSDLGYTAILLNPAAIEKYVGDNIKLPGRVSATEWDSFHDLIAIDEMARCGSLGVLWALGCGNAIGCPPVINFGTEEQKSRWLPPVIRGEIRFCLGITEPHGELSKTPNLFFQSLPINSSNNMRYVP